MNPARESFPEPFGGIEVVYGTTEKGLKQVVRFLMEEDPHGHNFAVSTYPPAIYLSWSGADCLTKYVEELI